MNQYPFLTARLIKRDMVLGSPHSETVPDATVFMLLSEAEMAQFKVWNRCIGKGVDGPFIWDFENFLKQLFFGKDGPWREEVQAEPEPVELTLVEALGACVGHISGLVDLCPEAMVLEPGMRITLAQAIVALNKPTHRSQET